MQLYRSSLGRQVLAGTRYRRQKSRNMQFPKCQKQWKELSLGIAPSINALLLKGFSLIGKKPKPSQETGLLSSRVPVTLKAKVRWSKLAYVIVRDARRACATILTPRLLNQRIKSKRDTVNFTMRGRSWYVWKFSICNLKRLLIAFFCLCFAITTLGEEVLITTNLGEIVIELEREKAPVTVAHFLGLVDSGAYKDTIFHRVVPGFMLQGGGYYLDMAEAEESEMIINEADNGLANVRGSIAMARMNEIDSASRQFFINVATNKSLDHGKKSCTRKHEATVAAARERGIYKPSTCRSFGFAVFGKVTSGMDVMDMIEVIETITVGEYDDVPATPITILSIDRMAAEKALSE